MLLYGEPRSVAEVKPELTLDNRSTANDYVRFTCSPLERGYGLTLGNALRRTLLSSTVGAAVTAVKIEGVNKEKKIEKVEEDETEILLNLKGVRLRLAGDEPAVASISVTGPGQARAADIKGDKRIEVINKKHFIAMVREGGKLSVTLKVENGKSYSHAGEPGKGSRPEQSGKQDQGFTGVDAMFSPIKRVDFNVTSATFGHRTDYDKLVMEIWTDGRITPDDAMANAARIIVNELKVFAYSLNIETEPSIEEEEPAPFDGDLLDTPIVSLGLSVRASKGLTNAGVNTLGELLDKSEAELMKTKNLGRKSLIEIIEQVHKLGLTLKPKI